MPIGSARIGVLGAGLVPGGTQTFNASGTFTVPPGVKKVNITGRGGTGNPGNAGNAGNPGNIGYGASGGQGGVILSAVFISNNQSGGGGAAIRKIYQRPYFGGCPGKPRSISSANYPSSPPFLYCPQPGNSGEPGPGQNGWNGDSGNAGTAGNAGNPGNAGNASNGLCKTFNGGSGGNAGAGGAAGNGGTGGTGGSGGAGGNRCSGSNSGGSGGNGAGSGASGVLPGSNTATGPYPNNPTYWVKTGGGGGGGAGINSGSSGVAGIYATQSSANSQPQVNAYAAGGTDPANPFNSPNNKLPCYAPVLTSNMTGGIGGNSGVSFAQTGTTQITHWIASRGNINSPPAFFNPNNCAAGRTCYANTDISNNNTPLNVCTNNMFRSGGGGGGGGGVRAGGCYGNPINSGNFMASAGGAGGGGRGNAGNAGGNSTGGAGQAGTPSTFNCLPVTPGGSYPITVGGPSGGQIVISWNPQ